MLKYPTRKKPKPREFQGILGRLKSIPLVLLYEKFIEMHFKIKVNHQYFNEIKEILNMFNDRVIIEILLN